MPRHSRPHRRDRRRREEARDGRRRGVSRQINIACIVDEAHPVEACVGDWVLVHVGFAMSRIDEAEAAETLKILRRTRRGAGRARSDAVGRQRSSQDGKRAQGALPVPSRRRSRTRRQLDAALLHSVAEKARDSPRDQRALLRRAGWRADRRRKGDRRGLSPTAAACSPWAMAARAAMPPISRSNSCIRSPPAGRRLPAINLVADLAMMSAVGNDLGFEHVFAPPDHGPGTRGDGLIGISTSGNSANLIAAFAKAKEMGIVTIGLAGGDGGKMKTSRRGRPLPGGADHLDPSHPGMPRRRLSHPLGSGAHAARRRRGSAPGSRHEIRRRIPRPGPRRGR